jgi:chaperone required for assembly of F1-ATPase
MKRIWTTATARPDGASFTIMLDDRPLKKPGGAALIVLFPALAEAIADEWRQAGLDRQEITPDDLPLTRLATTAQDRVQHARGDIIRQLAAYGLHDLLCYRAETPALATQEHELWQPWLDWAAAQYGVRLATGPGITPIPQPPDTSEKFTRALSELTMFQLASLGVAVPAMGSLVLGLALAAAGLEADTAFRLATLDETFQARQWGIDEDAEQRRETIRAELALCRRFMDLCTA